MVAVPSSWGRRLFPAVCIQFRTATRSSQIALSPAVQVSALAAFVAAATAFAYLGISQIGYVRLVGDKELAVARIERANVDLQDNVANLRDRLAASARDRAMAEDRLSALANETNTLRESTRIDRDETRRDRAEGLGARDTNTGADCRSRTGRTGPSQPTPSEATPAHREGVAPDLSAEAKRRAERLSLNSAAELSANSSASLPRRELTSPVCFPVLGQTTARAAPSYCRREPISPPGPSIRTNSP